MPATAPERAAKGAAAAVAAPATGADAGEDFCFCFCSFHSASFSRCVSGRDGASSPSATVDETDETDETDEAEEGGRAAARDGAACNEIGGGAGGIGGGAAGASSAPLCLISMASASLGTRVDAPSGAPVNGLTCPWVRSHRSMGARS